MMRYAKRAVEILRELVPNFQPKVGIVLGSGLGTLANEIEDVKTIPYESLPGFPRCMVEGHEGLLSLGLLKGIPIACLQGRAHFYEGYSHVNPEMPSQILMTPIQTLKLLGCQILLTTNSSGSLQAEIGPGSLVVINDHINFQFASPLIGIRDKELGSPFIGMEDAYDPQLRELLHAAAKDLNLNLTEGVYVGVLGPNFETPAEINAFRILGANVVGMSAIPEVITARYCGLRVAVVALITNLAAGMSEKKLSHAVTLQGAEAGIPNLTKLVLKFFEKLNI